MAARHQARAVHWAVPLLHRAAFHMIWGISWALGAATRRAELSTRHRAAQLCPQVAGTAAPALEPDTRKTRSAAQLSPAAAARPALESAAACCPPSAPARSAASPASTQD